MAALRSRGVALTSVKFDSARAAQNRERSFFGWIRAQGFDGRTSYPLVSRRPRLAWLATDK